MLTVIVSGGVVVIGDRNHDRMGGNGFHTSYPNNSIGEKPNLRFC